MLRFWMNKDDRRVQRRWREIIEGSEAERVFVEDQCRRSKVRRFAAAALAFVVMVACCTVTSDSGSANAHAASVQEAPISYAELRNAATSPASERDGARALAARFIAQYDPARFGASAQELDISRLKMAVILTGTVAPEGGEPFLRALLLHPLSDVRVEAGVWYKSINPAWSEDAETRRLVEEAIIGDQTSGEGS